MDFFAGTQFLGSVPRAPHSTFTSFIWTNAGLGAYSLTASTTDHQGSTWRSEPVQIRVRPVNDDFTNSFVIQGLDVVTNGTNLGAGKEPGEPSGGDPAADASVWYSWTAAASGQVVVNLQEISFTGHPLGVYLGNSVSNLTALGESINQFFPIGFVARAGVTYYIEVSGFSQSIPDGAGPFTLSLHQTPAPPNDDFGNAITLTGIVATATGSNVGATSEPGEPQESYLGVGNSVWWNWTSPAKGRLMLDFQGSDFDPVVSLYTGSVVSNLTLIGRVYTSFEIGPPVAGFDVEAGQNYNIALVGFWNASLEGNIVMNLSFEPAPTNDNFADRLPLYGLLARAAGSNTTASSQAGEPDSNGHTVWWSWTAPVSGPVVIGTDGSSFDPWLSVYTGTAITNLTTVTNGLALLTFNALAGTEYQISADANGGGQVGQIQLTLVAGIAANDAFTNRIPLNGTNVTAIGSTIGATREPLEPTHGGYPANNSIWWSWTAPATGTLTLTVIGDRFNPTWAIYTGSSLGALSLVGDSYVWPWKVRSSVSIPVQEGVPLQIAVDGAVQAGGGPAGIVTISLSFVGLPPNDNFADRILISGTSVHVAGNTSGATREPGEPDHAGYSGGHSIWWSWTPPGDGRVTLDAFGSALTTLAAVYTGNTVSALTNVASGNATFAPIEFDCQAGVAYQIALDHWYSNMFGAVDLNLLFSSVRLTSPTNDEVFHEPPAISFVATATVWDGIFAQMEFLSDGTVMGTVTNRPYSFIWTNPPLGDHTLQASVTDSNGVTRLSPSAVVHVRPVNDDFANRIPIPDDFAVLHAHGISATLEPGEPVQGPVSWESVWWTWTAPASGKVTLSKPSNLALRYVLMDVYIGSALTNLILVTNTPANLSGTLVGIITFDAALGTSYQIAIAGSFFDQYDVPISFAFDPTPAIITDQFGSGVALFAGAPILSQPEHLSSGGFRFMISGTPGLKCNILASTNSSAPASDWISIVTTNLDDHQAIIEDNQATNDQRYYRVKVVR